MSEEYLKRAFQDLLEAQKYIDDVKDIYINGNGTVDNDLLDTIGRLKGRIEMAISDLKTMI